jgi:peptide/nickel transport system substrate-binding protein
LREGADSGDNRGGGTATEIANAMHQPIANRMARSGRDRPARLRGHQEPKEARMTPQRLRRSGQGRLLTLAISTLLVVAACGPSGTPAPSGPAGSTAPGGTTGPTGQPVSGGTLTFARTADIFTFDPYNTQDDYSIFTELQVYDRLVRLSADGKGVDPELATAWTVAPDGLSATFTLRDGVKFSDGSPMTADDVVFSLSRAVDQQGSWGFLFSPVKSVSKVDESTVKMEMSEPFAPLLPALSTFAASIYSKANFEKYGDQAGEHPLGTGAFMLEKWDKGNQVILTKNPNYWQAGQPYLDKVIFTVVGDDNARVLQLQSAAADIIDFVPPNQVDPLKSSGAQIARVDGTSVGWMTLNEAKKPLDDPKVRCALAYAVDRQAIADNIYFGIATPAKSIIPSSTLFYDPNTNPISFDLEKARQLLSESSAAGGFTLNVTVPSGDSTRLATVQIWANALNQIGVTTNISQVEATTAQDEYNTEKYTVRVSAWTNDTPDPDEMMGAGLDYHNQNALHTGFHNDQMVDLVNQGRRELDPTKRQAIYTQIQQLVNETCPFIYTVEVPRLFATTAKIQGFAPNSQGKYSLENVWKAP